MNGLSFNQTKNKEVMTYATFRLTVDITKRLGSSAW